MNLDLVSVDTEIAELENLCAQSDPPSVYAQAMLRMMWIIRNLVDDVVTAETRSMNANQGIADTTSDSVAGVDAASVGGAMGSALGVSGGNNGVTVSFPGA